LTLYFTSERDGGYGGCDLYQATRSARGEPFGNLKHLGPGVNTEGFETDANPSPDELRLYFASDRPGTHGDRDLWMASRSSKEDLFDNVVNLGAMVNTMLQESYPSISADECTLFFSSNDRAWPPGIWVTTRLTRDSDFGPAINLVDFGLPVDCGTWTPSISADWPAPGSKLYGAALCTEEGIHWLAETTFVPSGNHFIRGDANADGSIDSADAIFTLSYLFASGSPPACLDAADTNDDGAVDMADGIYLLQHLFANGPAIPPPYPGCGSDPTPEPQGCREYQPCG
jgi:hypothetical protein